MNVEITAKLFSFLKELTLGDLQNSMCWRSRYSLVESQSGDTRR